VKKANQNGKLIFPGARRGGGGEKKNNPRPTSTNVFLEGHPPTTEPTWGWHPTKKKKKGHTPKPETQKKKKTGGGWGGGWCWGGGEQNKQKPTQTPHPKHASYQRRNGTTARREISRVSNNVLGRGRGGKSQTFHQLGRITRQNRSPTTDQRDAASRTTARVGAEVDPPAISLSEGRGRHFLREMAPLHAHESDVRGFSTFS